MMPRLTSLICAILLLCALSDAAFSAYAADCALLELKNAAGDLVYTARINPDYGFAIRYTHSVALTPVVDYFKVRDGKIILDRTEYSDFGAGLPHVPEAGQKMTVNKGRIIISGYDRALPCLELRVGRVAAHELLICKDLAGRNFDVLPLGDIVRAGQALKFEIAPGKGQIP